MMGCTWGGPPTFLSPQGERVALLKEQTLATVIPSEPPKLDWALSSDTSSSWIQENIMEGLVRFDLSKSKLELKPALATEWHTSDEGKTWIFKLRKNVFWTDGVEFTSQHVIDAFEYILKPESAAIAVDNIFPIKNAQKFNSGQITNFSTVGVKALDSYQIKFELHQPMTFFPMLLAHHTTFPIRVDVINKFGPLWTEPQNIVTLGPYQLVSWHHDSRIILQRNESYWGERPEIKFIIFYMIGKPSTSLRMFKRGKIDFMRDLPSSEISRLKLWPEFQSHPGLRLYYYGIKVNKRPLNSNKIRRALSLAIDREEVVKILGGGQKPLTGWIPVGMKGYDKSVGLQFNPSLAKELLKQEGYNDGNDFPTLTLGFNTEEKHKRVAENIQAQLKRNLGIKIELKNEEWKTFLDGLRSESAYSLFRLGWVADYADPHNFMSIMTSFSENNRTGWKNLKYDQMVAEGVKVTESKNRLKIYKKAQKLLVEDEAPVIPLFTDVNQLLVSERITGFKNNVLDLYHFFLFGLEDK